MANKETQVRLDIRLRTLPKKRAEHILKQAKDNNRKLPQQIQYMLEQGAKAKLWP